MVLKPMMTPTLLSRLMLMNISVFEEATETTIWRMIHKKIKNHKRGMKVAERVDLRTLINESLRQFSVNDSRMSKSNI